MGAGLAGPQGVLGLDLSMVGTGMCDRHGATKTIKTRKGDGDRRLAAIHQAIWMELHRKPYAFVLIEDLPTHAHSAGITGMVQGIARLACMQNATPYGVIVPSTLKLFATGSGVAGKADMRMAAFQRAGVDITDEDQCDAWWLWQAARIVLDPESNLLGLPKKQVAALFARTRKGSAVVRRYDQTGRLYST